MKLLTEKIKDTFKRIGSQEDDENPLVVVKFFTPWTHWTWFATEYNPETKCFFGMVYGDENEWGYFSLDELQGVKGLWGLKIERDIHFDPVRFNTLKLPQ